MGKITSIADAIEAIETLKQSRPMTRRSMSDIDPMSKARSFNSGLDAALETLRELEASVGERLEELKAKYPVEPKKYTSEVWYDSGEMATLRRILGEG
jgi:hypothetical protein